MEKVICKKKKNHSSMSVNKLQTAILAPGITDEYANCKYIFKLSYVRSCQQSAILPRQEAKYYVSKGVD